VEEETVRVVVELLVGALQDVAHLKVAATLQGIVNKTRVEAQTAEPPMMGIAAKSASRRITLQLSAGTGSMRIMFLTSVWLQLVRTPTTWTQIGTLIPVPRIMSLVNWRT